VTFFEIMTGRTPFEDEGGEPCESKEDIERYWHRTVCGVFPFLLHASTNPTFQLSGKWRGQWNFSKAMEKLLQRMMAPNADLRCTTAQALKDVYWKSSDSETKSTHRE